MSPSEDLLGRIRGEYTEMPGLRVTEAQARRLWGLDATTCRRALTMLIDGGFLRRTEAGEYARVSEGPAVGQPIRMAGADVSASSSSGSAARSQQGRTRQPSWVSCDRSGPE